MSPYGPLQIIKNVLIYLSCATDLVILLILAIMYVSESKFGKKMIKKTVKFMGEKQISLNARQKKFFKEKRYFEKYYELSPIDNIGCGKKDKENEAFEALDFALFKKSIHNIAITGPYGSGKSSVWESYKKKRMEQKLFPISSDELLEISLAKFTELNDNNLNDGEKDEQSVVQVNQWNNADNIDDKEKEEFDLERGILQQIVFSVESKIIPKSKIQKIANFSNWLYWGMGLSLICLYGWKIKVYVDFFAEYIEKLIDCGTLLGEKINISVPTEETIWSIVFFVLPTIVYIIASMCIFAFVRRIPSLCFSKISFKGLDIDLDERKGSLINQNITELIYFFEQTGKKIVVFEDIDRNKTNTIFVKLRELNRILNHCPKLLNQIKFVYMVRDDILPKYERTKFFDFIVPIVPVLNGDNAAQCIQNLFVRDEDDAFDDRPYLNPTYLKKIGRYVGDMRLAKNCFNEFRVYKRKNIEYLGNVGDEKMFSLILYKNLYPKDFQNLLKQKGVLYYCLNEAVKKLEESNNSSQSERG